MENAPAASLAPPGAGLPAPELFIARALFAVKRWTGSRNAFTAGFERERAAIRVLVDRVAPERRGERVLIKRLRGLEDSSRHWSVWMVLDHLRIVNQAIAKTMASLAAGVVPPGQASTAAVKPNPACGADVDADYELACDHVLAVVSAHPDLRSKVAYAHPWFGPLDAAGWHAMAATHLAIHRAQLEHICAGLQHDCASSS